MSDQSDPPTPHAPLLVQAGLHFVANRVQQAAYKELDRALYAAAVANEPQQFDALVRAVEHHPDQDKDAVFSALEVIADTYRCVSDNNGHALLMTIPMLIFTDHPTSDLDEETVASIKLSLHAHALADASISVVMMPWMNSAAGRPSNLVSRRRLLMNLVRPTVEGNPDKPPATDVVPEAVEKFQPNGLTCCVRYLTFALYSTATALGDLVTRWSDDALDEKIGNWSHDVAELIRHHGNYPLVDVGAPCVYSEGEMKGVLQQAMMGVRLFVTGLAKISAPPASECELALQYVSEGEHGQELFLYYRHGKRMIEANKIPLPECRWLEEQTMVLDTLSEIAKEAASELGIGRFNHVVL